MTHARSTPRAGSLRYCAGKRGIPILVFEAGEPQRFNEPAIRAGVKGILGVMKHLGLIGGGRKSTKPRSIRVESSSWVRARVGGLLRMNVREGERVEAHQEVGVISDPLGESTVPVKAPFDGLVLGKTNNPVVHGGDALVHLGKC